MSVWKPVSIGLAAVGVLVAAKARSDEQSRPALQLGAFGGGDAMQNLTVSKRRAEAVKASLVKEGIDAACLSAEGFGAARPIANNKTSAGREKSRSVGFHIKGAP